MNAITRLHITHPATPSDTDLIAAALDALDQLGPLGADEFRSLVQSIEAAVDDGEYATTVNRYTAEPYSWGGSRGTEVEADATLIRWTAYGMSGNRADAVRLIGEHYVKGREEWQAEVAAMNEG